MKRKERKGKEKRRKRRKKRCEDTCIDHWHKHETENQANVNEEMCVKLIETIEVANPISTTIIRSY